jgi:hypothetical protein
MSIPAESPFFIRLLVSEPLDKPVAREWFESTKANLPVGVLSSIQVDKEDTGIQNVFMVHRSMKDGTHQYEIPLSRDLIESEFGVISEAWQALFQGDHEIESSATDIKSARQGPADAIVIGETDYAEMCDTLAKHQHERWCRERTQQGWRYGLEMKAKDKTHPMLRPWEQLPDQYKNVDDQLPHLFMNILAQHGYTVVKSTDLQKWLKK